MYIACYFIVNELLQMYDTVYLKIDVGLNFQILPKKLQNVIA
jgi:hypothetical protein